MNVALFKLIIDLNLAKYAGSSPDGYILRAASSCASFDLFTESWYFKARNQTIK
jgi:hypothetical protein